MKQRSVSGATRAPSTFSRWLQERACREYFLTQSYLRTPAHHFCSRNRQSKLSSLTSFIPIPKYFESEWSYAQFRIPTQSAHISLTQQAAARDANPDLAEEEKCTVGWIEAPAPQTTTAPAPSPATDYQLIALTYTGGWYRLALPTKKPSSVSAGAAQTNITSSGSVRSGTARPPSVSSVTGGGRADKGKGVPRDSDRKEGRDCTLLEFRRFGSWDGWG